MNKFTALIAAVAALGVAAPAAANEGRGEIRGGVAWANGEEEAIVGAALGYDFDLGKTAFVGVEGSADEMLVDDATIVWGTTARVGARLGNGKLFATGGYSFGEGEDALHLGAGYQHALGENAYLKAEYRHFFSDIVDVNVVAAGLGMRF